MKSTGTFLFGALAGIAATIAYNSKTVQGWVKKAQNKYQDLKKQVQDKVREQEIEENLNELAEEVEEAITGDK